MALTGIISNQFGPQCIGGAVVLTITETDGTVITTLNTGYGAIWSTSTGFDMFDRDVIIRLNDFTNGNLLYQNTFLFPTDVNHNEQLFNNLNFFISDPTQTGCPTSGTPVLVDPCIMDIEPATGGLNYVNYTIKHPCTNTLCVYSTIGGFNITTTTQGIPNIQTNFGPVIQVGARVCHEYEDFVGMVTLTQTVTYYDNIGNPLNTCNYIVGTFSIQPYLPEVNFRVFPGENCCPQDCDNEWCFHVNDNLQFVPNLNFNSLEWCCPNGPQPAPACPDGFLHINIKEFASFVDLDAQIPDTHIPDDIIAT